MFVTLHTQDDKVIKDTTSIMFILDLKKQQQKTQLFFLFQQCLYSYLAISLLRWFLIKKDCFKKKQQQSTVCVFHFMISEKPPLASKICPQPYQLFIANTWEVRQLFQCPHICIEMELHHKNDINEKSFVGKKSKNDGVVL